MAKEYRQNSLEPYETAEESTAEASSNSSKGGNTGLPFGLCKKYGIDLPDDATPRDAWEALKGLGITPESVYKTLKEKGTVKDLQTESITKKYQLKRHNIDEGLAQRARESYSMWGYEKGSATQSYNNQVSKFEKAVNDLVDRYKNNTTLTDEDWAQIDSLTEAYGKRYANYINESNKVESSYPSWFIAGPANYNVKKSEAKNSRLRSLYEENEKYLDPEDNPYLRKIQAILSNASIKSNDSNVIGKLEQKLTNLQNSHAAMLAANAYIRKNGTLEGFKHEHMTEDELNKAKDFWDRWHYSPFYTSNTSAEIRRVKDRIESIKKVKEGGGTATEYPQTEGVEIEENAEEMRVQLRFDGKPDESTRTLLKSYGFRWSPSQGAWQRQLNGNGKYAAKQVLEKINSMNK